MDAAQRLSAFEQFAREDIKTVRKEGAMSITESIFGAVHLTLDGGIVHASIPKYGWNVSGPDDEIVKFLTQVYRIIEE